MLTLNNQATAATYPTNQGTGCSLGPSNQARNVALAIYNATVYVQLALPDDPTGQETVRGWHWSSEFALTPQNVTFVGALGFRARDFTSGTHGTLFAQVYEKYDPVTPGGSP